MSHTQAQDGASMILGIATSTAVGGLLFDSLGALLLGLLGAAGSWIFIKLIRPRLDDWLDKKKKAKEEKKDKTKAQ